MTFSTYIETNTSYLSVMFKLYNFLEYDILVFVAPLRQSVTFRMLYVLSHENVDQNIKWHK